MTSPASSAEIGSSTVCKRSSGGLTHGPSNFLAYNCRDCITKSMMKRVTATLLIISLSSCANALSTRHDGVDRREAIQRAIVTTSGAGLWLPTASSAESVVSQTATLSDGTKFPLASFGLQIYDDDMAYKLTLTALEVGYRNFFASVLAGNQKGFARAIKDSLIPRSDLFICGSVVSNRAAGYESAKQLTTKGWKRNMECFSVGEIDYLDQIMLDYPVKLRRMKINERCIARDACPSLFLTHFPSWFSFCTHL